MYRDYENPRTLEKRLEEARQALESAKQRGADLEEIISLHEDVEDLRERVNFAYQDAEA